MKARGTSSLLQAYGRFGLWFAAVACGVIGCWAVFTPTTINGTWGALTPIPWTAARLWWLLALLLAGTAQAVVRRTPDERMVLADQPPPPIRWRWLIAAIPYLVAAISFHDGDHFTLAGVMGWLGGIVLLILAFVPRPLAGIHSAWRRAAQVMRDDPLYVIGLAAILVVALAGRLYLIDEAPPELNHDHIEKLLDTQAIVEGAFPIFIANNGGREPLHFYLLALLSHLTGGVNRTTLHLGAILESVVGVAALAGLGAAVIGGDPRRARRFGLVVALIGATVFWYLMVTRVGLRIALTPLFATLTLWALVRLLRGNRRSDAVLVGLLLGTAVYGYQALRILPLVAAAACLAGLLWRVRPFAERRRYLGHLAVSALCAVAVALPLLAYAVRAPDAFWQRVRINIQGWCSADPALACVSLDEGLRELSATARLASLMLTYRGDPQWPYNAPDYPALDPLAGGLFLAGLAGLVVITIRRRDAVAGVIVCSFVIMLLPTALSVGLPGETPSSNRASGALPAVCVCVAFALFSLVEAALRLRLRSLRLVTLASVPAAGAVMLIHGLLVISGPFTVFYSQTTISQREVGQYMRHELDSGARWGNIYLLRDSHGAFDGRGALLEAGVMPLHFPPSDVLLQDVPVRLFENWMTQDATVALDPDHDMIFIYSPRDVALTQQLEVWFPTGAASTIPNWIGLYEHSEFTVFRVPALGDAELIRFLRAEVDLSAYEY